MVLLSYFYGKERGRLLCLWLPFTDGTTKNQGLIQDGITTGVTPTFINDGKLGKCLNQGQIDMSADTTAKILNNQELTICFWLYVNAEEGSTTKRGMLFGNSGTGVNDNRKFSLFQYPTCNDLHLSWMNDTANTMFLSAIWQAVLPSYKWTHVAVTYSNPDATIYINGQIYAKHTGISNSSSFAYNTRVVWNNADRYLNDFRIYNTCLSPRQIKEISKGLVCHYPLGAIDGRIGGRNLIKNGKGNVKAGFFRNFPTVTDEYGEFTLKSKKTYSGINLSNSFVYGCREYDVGEKYTWSYDIMYTDWNFPTGTNRQEFWMGQRYGNAPSGETATGTWRGVTQHNLPVVGQNGCELNKWYHVKQTVTIPEQASSNVAQQSGISFYNSNANVEASFTARLKNVKLEKFSTATPWTPAPEDDASFYDNVIYDTSGYNNNGSVSGDILWDTNTPRYKGAYDFNGTGYIKNDNFGVYFKEFTISYWIKIPKSITAQHFAFGTFNNFTGNGVGSWRDLNLKGYSTIIKSDGETSYGSFNQVKFTPDTWYFVSFVYTGTTLKTYINGKIYGNIITYGKNGNVNMPVLYIGNSLYNGTPNSETDESSVVDFRIYSTALFDTDILDLYQTSASVDNNGNLLLAGEVIEE